MIVSKKKDGIPCSVMKDLETLELDERSEVVTLEDVESGDEVSGRDNMQNQAEVSPLTQSLRSTDGEHSDGGESNSSKASSESQSSSLCMYWTKVDRFVNILRRLE